MSFHSEELTKLLAVVEKLSLSWECRLDWNTGMGWLYLYLIKDGKVFFRLDFDLREGINYGLVIGMCKKAISGELKPVDDGYPYPVWRQRAGAYQKQGGKP